jgi:hypothetical protein
VPPTGKKSSPYLTPSGQVPGGYRVPVPELPSLALLAWSHPRRLLSARSTSLMVSPLKNAASCPYFWALEHSSVSRTSTACLAASTLSSYLLPEGVFVYSFYHFFINFREIQKLDGLKNKKLEASFHELLSFSVLGSSSF